MEDFKYRMAVRDDCCEWTDLGFIEAKDAVQAFVKVLMEQSAINNGEEHGWVNAEFYYNDKEELERFVQENIRELEKGQTLIPFVSQGYNIDNGNSAIIVAIPVKE
jgi:hypothetical protein